MALSFTKHLEGCTPMTPCVSCKATSVIRGGLKDALEPGALTHCWHIIQGLEDSGDTIFEHAAACTPIRPCSSCIAVAVLKEVITPAAFEALVEIVKSGGDGTQTPVQADLATPIDDLNLPYRLHNALLEGGCKTLGDVTGLTKYQILGMPGVGEVSLRELRERLAEKGLSLAS